MLMVTSALTVLLVQPPQLDLVGFVLGLLLQPAGPANRRERESVVSLYNQKLLSFPPHDSR